MDAQGLSQRALVRATGLSPGTVCDLYNDKVTRFDKTTLERLMVYFNLDSMAQLIHVERSEPVISR
jgi:transcriptional regulator with XRE-family HTH domain